MSKSRTQDGAIVNIILTMRQNILLLTCGLFIFLAGCNNNYGDGFYGIYTDDRFEGYSRLTFYRQNTYSFNFYGPMINHDSGTVVLRDDTLYFTSFYKKRDELDIKNNNHYRRTLTGHKFTFRKDRIYYIGCHTLPDKNKVCDTLTWKKDR